MEAAREDVDMALLDTNSLLGFEIEFVTIPRVKFVHVTIFCWRLRPR